MIYLLIVSLIWAFSFGLIKGQLTGLDANFVAAARLVVSLAAFLPFLRIKQVTSRLRWRLLVIGAVQFGLMYVAYTYAFQYLQAYEVALFTIFTPLYVTLINDAYQKRFHAISLGAGRRGPGADYHAVAVIGADRSAGVDPDLPGSGRFGAGILPVERRCAQGEWRDAGGFQRPQNSAGSGGFIDFLRGEGQPAAPAHRRGGGRGSAAIK